VPVRAWGFKSPLAHTGLIALLPSSNCISPRTRKGSREFGSLFVFRPPESRDLARLADLKAVRASSGAKVRPFRRFMARPRTDASGGHPRSSSDHAPGVSNRGADAMKVTPKPTSTMIKSAVIAILFRAHDKYAAQSESIHKCSPNPLVRTCSGGVSSGGMVFMDRTCAARPSALNRSRTERTTRAEVLTWRPTRSERWQRGRLRS
jgi:hypothetical protein